MLKGTKRFGVSDSKPDTDDSAFRNKRIMAGSPFDVHRAETSQQQPTSTPQLDLQRAESSRQHVRALNTQFASWVQTQLKDHPDELWEDGVQDYLAHASNIMEKFTDVVKWLKANSGKGESLPAAGSHTAEKKLIPETKIGSTPVSTAANSATSWSFGLLPNNQSSAGAFFNSESSAAVFSSNQSSTGAISNNKSSAGSFSNNQSSFSNSLSSAGAFSNSLSSAGAFSNNQSSAGAFSNSLSSAGAFSNNQSSTGVFSNNLSSGALLNKQNSGLFSGAQSQVGFGGNQIFGAFSNSQRSRVSSNDQSSGLFSNNQTIQSSGLFSNNQTPFSFGNQSSVPANSNASDDADGENELEAPSSPSVKKTEEKGVVVVHEVKCKLYVKSSDPADKDAWKDKGTGQLSIKCKEGVSKGAKESKPTILVRNDVGKLLLNALLYPGIKTNSQKNSIVAIFHTAGDGDGNGADDRDNVVARTFLFRLKSAEDRDQLATAIQEYAPSS
ncbi:hypothetical protein FNV43_RR09193 [Rhamnella rubrinervis]|uniref:RanBD1 domain-containing protein n=1 Tax=Rhamnella rubrinervis TaxID=2594499 RepID=A0A8K0HA14_9ROSA|nr:hypothetical protein FNV43_RR09193 [Rhamnella rubrinervis]